MEAVVPAGQAQKFQSSITEDNSGRALRCCVAVVVL